MDARARRDIRIQPSPKIRKQCLDDIRMHVEHTILNKKFGFLLPRIKIGLSKNDRNGKVNGTIVAETLVNLIFGLILLSLFELHSLCYLDLTSLFTTLIFLDIKYNCDIFLCSLIHLSLGVNSFHASPPDCFFCQDSLFFFDASQLPLKNARLATMEKPQNFFLENSKVN